MPVAAAHSLVEDHTSVNILDLHRFLQENREYRATSPRGDRSDAVRWRGWVEDGDLFFDNGQWKYHVSVGWRPCHFGGERPFFFCPECSRRCRILYLTDPLACRKCLGLAYKTQRQEPWQRQATKARRLRRKLGADEDRGCPIAKPAGQHWETFIRLTDEIAELEGTFSRLRTHRGGTVQILGRPEPPYGFDDFLRDLGPGVQEGQLLIIPPGPRAR